MNPGALVVRGDARRLPLPDASVDAIVCDPPYALPGGFMGKTWDRYDDREDAGFAYWLMGLIDGEGHFGIKAQRGPGSETHVPFFALKLRADERPTMDYILRELRIGQVQDERRTDGNPMVRWVVQSKPDCQRLVDVVDKYGLRAKKRMDYALWREAVCEWTNRPRGNRWHGPTDDRRMRDLKHRMETVRTYVDPPWSGHEFQDWCRTWAWEALRVVKPGGHLLAFGGTRSYHRLVAGLEDAGWEIRDSIGCLTWMYASGFPKSRDVSKAIDAEAGAVREVIGSAHRATGNATYDKRPSRPDGLYASADYDITAPATEDAARWQGWGTALKPAWEPIIVARKPLAGTVAGNVLAWGTGAINVGACRVGVAPGDDIYAKNPHTLGGFGHGGATVYGESAGAPKYDPTAGRWPTNLVLVHHPDCADGCVDGCHVADLDAQSGNRPPSFRKARTTDPAGATWSLGRTDQQPFGHHDSGGASRFYPVFRFNPKADTWERPTIVRDGKVLAHATVKPVDLMRWLVRLVCPPGGLVLDPFAGSGSTLQAAQVEGFRSVGVELDAEGYHIDLIRERLSWPVRIDGEGRFERMRPAPVPAGQIGFDWDGESA
jgi:hypothetical protein